MTRFDPDAPASLEQQLRAHFLRRFGPPPDPDAVWTRLVPHLREQAETDREPISAGPTAHEAPGSQPSRDLSPYGYIRGQSPTGPRQARSRLARYVPLVAVLLIAVASAALFGVFGAGLQRGGEFGVSTATASRQGTPYGTGTADLRPATSSCQGADARKAVCRTPEPTSTPDLAQLSLQQVQMLSADDGWALGGDAMLHYSGGRWSVAFTLPGATLTGLSMDGPDDGWAVGAAQTEPFGVMLHYTGGRWTTVALPSALQPNEGIRSVDMVSSTEGWAMVLGSSDADSFLHYANGQWIPVGPPGPGPVALSMVSATDGWAVGSFARSPVFERYSGGRWVVMHPTIAGASGPIQVGGLFGASMLPSGEGWAVGSQGTILHYVNGTWTLMESGTLPDLYAVQMLSPNEGWAVGYRGTILHYTNGAWTLQPGP